MSNKGLETLYEWQMNIYDEDGFECITHWDIKDTESVIDDIKNGRSNDVEIIKRQGSDCEGELSRDYFQLNETSDLPKYIQKYVNKVKEEIS